MVRRRGPRLTLAEKTETVAPLAPGRITECHWPRAAADPPMSVRYEVARTGGIPPSARQRGRLALTLVEREAISRGLARGTSLRHISRQVRRAPSTVSREVQRHGGRRRYRAAAADAAAWARGRRPKRCRLATHPALRDAVATKLAHAWSPQQIAGWLRRAYPDDPSMHVSHEAILSQPVRAKPRRAEKGPAGALAPAAHDSASAHRGAQVGWVHRRGRLQFASAPPRSRTARSPGTGRATCSSVPDSPTWRRWWSGARATSVSSGWQGARRARSCRRSPSTSGGCPPGSWPR